MVNIILRQSLSDEIEIETSQNEAAQGVAQIENLIASVNRTLAKLFKHFPSIDDLNQEVRFIGVVESSINQLKELVEVSRQQGQAYRKRASAKSKHRDEEVLVRFCLRVVQLTGRQHYKQVEELIDLAYMAEGLDLESRKDARIVGDRVRQIVARFRKEYPTRYRKICKEIGLPVPLLPDTRTDEEKAKSKRIADQLNKILFADNKRRR
jgi:hypothetical protein